MRLVTRLDDSNSSWHTIGISNIEEVTVDASTSSEIDLPAFAAETSNKEAARSVRKEIKISDGA